MKNVFFLSFANMNLLQGYYSDPEGCHLFLDNGIHLQGQMLEDEFLELYEGMPIAYYQNPYTKEISFWGLKKDWQQRTTFLFDNDEVEAAFAETESDDSPGNLIFVRFAEVEKIKSIENVENGMITTTETGKTLFSANSEEADDEIEIVLGVTEIAYEPDAPNNSQGFWFPKEFFPDQLYLIGSEEMMAVMDNID